MYTAVSVSPALAQHQARLRNVTRSYDILLSTRLGPKTPPPTFRAPALLSAATLQARLEVLEATAGCSQYRRTPKMMLKHYALCCAASRCIGCVSC